MKLLQVGDFRFDYYDKALLQSFESFGLIDHVDSFSWCAYFSNYDYSNVFNKLYYTFENRYKFGPLVRKLNLDLIDKVRGGGYDVVFLWRAVHIYPSTIRELRKHAVVIGYNNDQTFSRHHPWWLFYLLRRSMRYYDHYFVYRPSDISKIEELDVSSTVFMPTFDKSRVYPLTSVDRYYDVAFIGHYEDDGRDELLLKLVKAGFKVRLNGQRWYESRYFSELQSYFGEIKAAYDGYNEALNSAKVCLSFLSKLNNDTYTRRTLEIPATKTVMLAEYTKEQAAMFEPDVEAVYFKNHDEAINKLYFLLEHSEQRESIAQAGYNKVIEGPYQLADRVHDIISIFNAKNRTNND
ncbi:glycosyltransferase [Vibrio cyclitrophicus]|uniref:glycosyltransferase family protein n=1 Tax=Vibrio cyclitrophicus TaxID=47951 RepID=UPI00029AB910|nr:glycosyltransferase [Vibrio cyclitrophicus]OEE21943.1 hypothetical protein OAM_22255 [Vibrio cyclitrophicus ZF14]